MILAPASTDAGKHGQPSAQGLICYSQELQPIYLDQLNAHSSKSVQISIDFIMGIVELLDIWIGCILVHNIMTSSSQVDALQT